MWPSPKPSRARDRPEGNSGRRHVDAAGRPLCSWARMRGISPALFPWCCFGFDPDWLCVVSLCPPSSEPAWVVGRRTKVWGNPVPTKLRSASILPFRLPAFSRPSLPHPWTSSLSISRPSRFAKEQSRFTKKQLSRRRKVDDSTKGRDSSRPDGVPWTRTGPRSSLLSRVSRHPAQDPRWMLHLRLGLDARSNPSAAFALGPRSARVTIR